MEQSTSQGFYLHHLPYFSLLNELVPGTRLLQLGGGGYTAQYAAHMGAQVTCALKSEAALKQTSALYPVPGMALALAPGEALPFPDNSFELIMLFEHLSHVSNPSALIAELKRVLSPEGLAVITLPNFERDDLREIMGEGQAPPSTLSPGEVYDPLTERFNYVSLLTQAPFLGYLVSQYAEVPKPADFETLPGASESPLFYAFLVSDLEIVLEADRLCPVPFSHMVDRLQGGLRRFHRALEHKNNALLELREEVSHLSSSNDALLGRADAAEAHLTQLKAAVEEALTQGDAPPLASLAAALEPPQTRAPKGTLPEEEEGEDIQLSGVSEGELRLLMEGLQGEDIEGDLRSLNEGERSNAQASSPSASELIPGDDSELLFQEDLSPFILPGPVPLYTELRRENARLRERLRLRTFAQTELEARQDALDDLIGSISRSVESHLGELRRWDPRDPMTQQWEEFRDLIGVIQGTASGDALTHLESSPGQGEDDSGGEVSDAFESALRLRREIAALEESLGEAQAKLRAAFDEVQGLQNLQRSLEAELGERAEAGRELTRERETLRRRLLGADEEVEGLQEAVARLENRNEELKEQLKEKGEEAEAHLFALQESDARIEALEAEAQRLKSSEEKAGQSLAIAQEHIDVMQAERAEAELAREAALGAQSTLQAELKYTEDRLEVVERNLQSAQNSLAVMTTRQGTLEAELKASRERVTELEATIRAAFDKATPHSAEGATLRDPEDFDTPEQELIHLREALKASEAKASQWESRAEDWEAKALTLKSTLADVESKVETLESMASPDAEAAPKDDNEVLSLKAEVATLSEALAGAQVEINAREQEREKAREALRIANEATRLAEERAEQAKLAAAHAVEEADAAQADSSPPESTPALSEELWETPSHTDPSKQSRLMASLREIKERLVDGLVSDDWEDDTFGPEATQRLPPFSDMAPEASADEAAMLSLTIQQGVERLFALVDLRARNLREAHERGDALESNLEALSRALAEAEPELTALQAQVGELLSKGEAYEGRITKLSEERRALEEEQSALQKQLDESEEDRARLQEDLTKALEERSGAEELARATARVTELEHTIQSLKEEAADLEQAQERLLQLEDAMHQLSAQRKELELRLAKRDEELGELQAEVQRAWSQAIGGGDGGSVSVATDTDGEDVLTDSVEALDSDPVQVLEERVSHLEQALQGKESQVERLLQEMDIKASHNRTLQELVGRHQKELRGVRHRLKDAIDRVAQIDASQSKLRGLSLEDLRQRLDELPE